jgi:hypothetical protein
MNIENSKLAFQKTTIRNLTDVEVDAVSGGTVALSSMPCIVAGLYAAEKAAEYAREMWARYA